MRIGNSVNNITFSSKINFVTYDEFCERVNPRKAVCIPSTSFAPEIVKGDEFYSVQLRSCSGGGIVEPDISSAGFHSFDSKYNLDKAEQVIERLFELVPGATGGLIIGGKNLPDAIYSEKQFDKLKEGLLKKIKNVSIFKMHTHPSAETYYHYSLPEDTWTICSQSPSQKGRLRFNDVMTLKQLKSAFSDIKIADGDELYINYEKISPKEAPEFFDKVV